MGKLSLTLGQRYVDLMSDAGFKAVFADKSNKELLISLLNHILPEGFRVSDIVNYLDRERGVDGVGGKKSILDLVCVDSDGKTFSVEVQRRKEHSFFERCVYYACELYHGNLKVGKRYDSLRPVHVTAITSFKCPHVDDSLWGTDHAVSNYGMTELRTGELARPTIFLNFVELERFTKGLSECETERDWLFYWFKHGWEHDEAPCAMGGGSFLRSLAKACEVAAFPLEKRREYDKDMLTELDIISQREYAVEEAVTKNLIMVAERMLAKGRNVSEIVEMTGLSEDVVSALSGDSALITM